MNLPKSRTGTYVTVMIVIATMAIVGLNSTGGAAPPRVHSGPTGAPNLQEEGGPRAPGLGGLVRDYVPATTPVFPTASFVRKVVSQQFSGAIEVFDVASVERKVLVALALDNGSYALVLSNVKTNTSTFLGVTPGGGNNVPESVVAADGRFYVSFLNFTTDATTFEQVSTTGVVSVPALPLPNPSLYSWNFVFGNSTTLYAAATGLLEEVNLASNTVVNSFPSMPGALLVYSVLPAGTDLYVAGTFYGGVGGSEYFGVIDSKTDVVTAISTIHYTGTDLYGGFGSLGMKGSAIYVGGGRFFADPSPYNVTTLEGYFYRYLPATGTFTNLSGLLPTTHTWVFALEPWKSTLLLYTGSYAFTSTRSTASAGIYKIGVAGTKLVNLSALLPANFLGDFAEISSGSGGYVYLGGDNTASNLAEIVAVQT